MQSKSVHKTSIGGQALIEGVMMRGPQISAMSVRLPNNNIETETWNTSDGKKPWYKKALFVRGVVNFIEMNVFGYKCLMKSAEKAGIEEEEPTKFEKWITEKLGDKLMAVLSAIAMVLSLIFAVGLFMVLPTTIVKLLQSLIPSAFLTIIEGAIKITIFVLYLALVSQLKDIKRVFSYHGAEHKTIACYEAGEELTVENIRRYTRFHPRCGTSFLLIVLVVSVLVFSMLEWNNAVIRILLKLLLLPVVVGISYEIIKLAGRYDNFATRIISAPGMWLQRLTTREPDDSMIEVAIEAMKPCIPQDNNEDKW
ncbi:MAG TPA: DUF1385 domain-containing protein [Ruminococcaceae bacterium]|nr:DUF1385 domain-containing protein [Oscillospiraceae bacterium]